MEWGCRLQQARRSPSTIHSIQRLVFIVQTYTAMGLLVLSRTSYNVPLTTKEEAQAQAPPLNTGSKQEIKTHIAIVGVISLIFLTQTECFCSSFNAFLFHSRNRLSCCTGPQVLNPQCHYTMLRRTRVVRVVSLQKSFRTSNQFSAHDNRDVLASDAEYFGVLSYVFCCTVTQNENSLRLRNCQSIYVGSVFYNLFNESPEDRNLLRKNSKISEGAYQY